MISCRHGWNSPFHTSCLPALVWACYCCLDKWVYLPELVTVITGIRRNRIQSWCLCPFSLHVCNSSGIKGQTATRHSHTCTHVGHPLSVCERRLGGLMIMTDWGNTDLHPEDPRPQNHSHLKHCSWTSMLCNDLLINTNLLLRWIYNVTLEVYWRGFWFIQVYRIIWICSPKRFVYQFIQWPFLPLFLPHLCDRTTDRQTLDR